MKGQLNSEGFQNKVNEHWAKWSGQINGRTSKEKWNRQKIKSTKITYMYTKARNTQKGSIACVLVVLFSLFHLSGIRKIKLDRKVVPQNIYNLLPIACRCVIWVVAINSHKMNKQRCHLQSINTDLVVTNPKYFAVLLYCIVNGIMYYCRLLFILFAWSEQILSDWIFTTNRNLHMPRASAIFYMQGSHGRTWFRYSLF